MGWGERLAGKSAARRWILGAQGKMLCLILRVVGSPVRCKQSCDGIKCELEKGHWGSDDRTEEGTRQTREAIAGGQSRRGQGSGRGDGGEWTTTLEVTAGTGDPRSRNREEGREQTGRSLV